VIPGDRVTIDDVRKAGHCTAGARRWFEANGLNFRRFLAEGMTEAELLATGDAIAEQVVRARRDRARG
jgi:hypothetical protein